MLKHPRFTALDSTSSSNRSPVAATASRSGIVEILRSKNVRDHDVVEKARDGVLRVGKARGSSGESGITDRGSHGGMRDVGGHVKGVVCARLCVEASERADNDGTKYYRFFVAGVFSVRRDREGKFREASRRVMSNCYLILSQKNTPVNHRFPSVSQSFPLKYASFIVFAAFQ
jgi:hypothetical protein